GREGFAKDAKKTMKRGRGNVKTVAVCVRYKTFFHMFASENVLYRTQAASLFIHLALARG
ncbi:MAG: hypothetical protein Q4G71_15110, partial [Pseudomonadota bacterium]|nr:hypothetical protein [Pseudomonadota bacterium]